MKFMKKLKKLKKSTFLTSYLGRLIGILKIDFFVLFGNFKKLVTFRLFEIPTINPHDRVIVIAYIIFLNKDNELGDKNTKQ